MSDDFDPEQVREGFDGGGDDDPTGSPVDPAAGKVDEEVVSVSIEGDAANQVDHTSTGPVLVRDDSNDTRMAEHGGREDMFVDCPDEIETSETQQNVEDKDGIDNAQSSELDSGMQIDTMMAEIHHLRNMLDKSSAERESLARDFEQERAASVKSLAHLYNQLKALKEPLPYKNDSELVDNFQETEGEQGESFLSGAPMHEIINECSRFVNFFLDECSPTERKIKEYRNPLHSKDEEIEDLNARVAELSVSQDVTLSYFNSEQQRISQLCDVQGDTINRILDSVAAFHQEDLQDLSITGKISQIEKCVSFVIGKYNLLLSGIDQLRHSLMEVVPDLSIQDEIGIFAHVHEKLLELRTKEVNLEEKLSQLEDENRKLAQQIDQQKTMVENANAEIGKLHVEIEQEKTRYANTKEKLSLAVTKGKALVQQRDVLKQSLAEKTSELEKSLAELQGKASALEAAEQSRESLAGMENLSASLQAALAEKDNILQKCEEILSEAGVTGENQYMDLIEKVRMLADERNALKGVSLGFHKLRDALSSFEFPETATSDELDVKLHWLMESFYQSKEEVLKLRDEVTTGREALMEKEVVLQKCEEIISEAVGTDESQYVDLIDKVRMLADERNALKGTSMEFHKLRDVLSSFDFPGNAKSDELDAQVHWLVESFYRSKEEMLKLQDVIAAEKEASANEINRLVTSLLVETQEKIYIQDELDILKQQHEGITQKERHLSMEKEKMVSRLLEASWITLDGQDEVHESKADTNFIIEKCLAKLKDGYGALQEHSHLDVEIFERLQTLLYIRDHEWRLYEEILMEETVDRAEVDRLSNELVEVTRELRALKEEKDSIQGSLEQYEEKVSILREKLSMAVKKGKGLVQERENFKAIINERNTDIERLKSELQQQISTCSDYMGQINKLSADAVRVGKLEADLAVTKEQRDQLEQFLVESNTMLQKVIESIENIVAPDDLTFAEPVEKLNWLSGYLNECQIARTILEQELENAKEHSESMSKELAESEKSVKSLEDSLLTAESRISQLLEEKIELEVSKANVEQELSRAKEEASSQASKFAEASAAENSLLNALSVAEHKLSVLFSEKEDALISKVTIEKELDKVKEEFSAHASRFTEAEKSIQFLEDALTDARTDVSLLDEENEKARLVITDLESEINKLREEATSHSTKLADASLTIKSLDDKLFNAENELSGLVADKKGAEVEILELNSKLNACMQELAGTHGCVESRDVELLSHIGRLQSVLKDRAILFVLQQSFEKKIEKLKDIDVLLREMGHGFCQIDDEMQQNHPALMEESSLSTLSLGGHDKFLNIEMVNGVVNARDGENIDLHIGKTVEAFHLRDKILADKFESYSTLMDDIIIALLNKLQAAKDGILNTVELVQSLKQKVNNAEMDKQAQESRTAVLESNLRNLSSACTEATKQLTVGVQDNLLYPSSDHKPENLDESSQKELGASEVFDNSSFTEAAEKLIIAARHNQYLVMEWQNLRIEMAGTIEDLQNKLKETESTCERVLQEKDLHQDRISKLETDLEVSQALCNELRLKLEDYHEKESELKEKEAEFRSWQIDSLPKEQDDKRSPLSEYQIRSLFDKINEIEISLSELEAGDLNDSAEVRKLFYIAESFSRMQLQVKLLSHDKEKLQSIYENQVLEIEQLKEVVEKHASIEKNFENMEDQFSEIALGLKNIILKLESDDMVKGLKEADATELLRVLDRLVQATVAESENLKSKTEELDAELIATQNVVDELSNKVRLFEDHSQGKVAARESVQERGIFEASSSPAQIEISEIQDMGPVSKSKTVPPVPTAAHSRTLRKGSSDQLAINIDNESEQLINKEDSDEDKGHIFKSLNTSGVIPRQGRMIADRIDGVWVSGGRALMSRPRARLGLIAYWLFLHIWLLGSIL